jgi:hypothetical protein
LWFKYAEIRQENKKKYREEHKLTMVVGRFIFMKNKKLFKQGVCRTMALPITLKSILRKRRIMETQIFHHVKNIIYKKSSKRNPKSFKILYNSGTNLKFQHKPNYHLSKILV